LQVQEDWSKGIILETTHEHSRHIATCFSVVVKEYAMPKLKLPYNLTRTLQFGKEQVKKSKDYAAMRISPISTTRPQLNSYWAMGCNARIWTGSLTSPTLFCTASGQMVLNLFTVREIMC
jgi:hypothetical protein